MKIDSKLYTSLVIVLLILSCKTMKSSSVKDVGTTMDDGLGGKHEIRIYTAADKITRCMAQCPVNGFDRMHDLKNPSSCWIGALENTAFQSELTKVRNDPQFAKYNDPDVPTWATFNRLIGSDSEVRNINQDSELGLLIRTIATKVFVQNKKYSNFGPAKSDDGLGGTQPNPAWQKCVSSLPPPSTDGATTTVGGDRVDDGWRLMDEEGTSDSYYARRIELINKGNSCQPDRVVDGITFMLDSMVLAWDESDWGIGKPPRDFRHLVELIIKTFTDGKNVYFEDDKNLISTRHVRFNYKVKNSVVPLKVNIVNFYQNDATGMNGAFVTKKPDPRFADHFGSSYSVDIVTRGSCVRQRPNFGGEDESTRISAPCIKIVDTENISNICGFKEVSL